MARITDEVLDESIKSINGILSNGTSLAPNLHKHDLNILRDLQECRSLLNDFLARMVDVYDGAEGADNRMPFAGSDIEDIRRVVG